MTDGDDRPPQHLDHVYDELKKLAAAQFRGQAAHHTLQATALVHEAWMRIGKDEEGFNDRRHFFAAAAKAMRHVLVDHARRVAAVKRGGEQQRVSLHSGDGESAGAPPADVLDLEKALAALEQEDARVARVVELKFYAGMTIPEIADALNVSHMTVSTDWKRARLFLARELS